MILKKLVGLNANIRNICIRLWKYIISKFIKRGKIMEKSVRIIHFIFINGFLGGYDGQLLSLSVFTLIASISSAVSTIYNNRLSLNIVTKGICQKVLIFILVGMANILDKYIISTESTLRTVTIFFYISNEGATVLKNATYIGLVIPQKIKDILEKFQ